nr:hypothetical transcript [Hymenolepis microstoma]
MTMENYSDPAPNRRQISRRYFKRPLVSVVPLISDHPPFHQSDELSISDPPDFKDNHLVIYRFALDRTPRVDRSTVCQLPPLHFPISSSQSQISDVFPISKSVHLHTASLPPLAIQSEGDTFQIQDTGTHNNSTEGMDGVAVGAATCLLASRKRLKPPNGMLNADQAVISKAKAIANEAIKKNKVFAVLGPYRHIREGLRRRGWVEKFYRAPIVLTGDTVPSTCNIHAEISENSSTNLDIANSDVDYNVIQEEDLPHSANGRRLLPWEEKNGFYGLLGKNVKDAVPNFIWSLKKAHIDFRYLRPDQIVNHHVKTPFTTKIGLCRQLRHINQFSDKNEDFIFPRCYVITSEEEKARFIKEFRLTACMAMLKWTCNYYNPPSQFTSSALDPDAPVKQVVKQVGIGRKTNNLSLKRAISMALMICENYLKCRRKDATARALNFSESQWDSFLGGFYATQRHASPFSKDAEIVQRCRHVCNSLKLYCPQFNFDGQRNIWIVKPGSKSRGRGITCHDSLSSIMSTVTDPNNLDNRFVVQKYIERPLLIYKTKFDIRQWFLISDWQPLTIWWYNECYIRFCCREFTLDNLSEDIHLSNNAITQKYKNMQRSPLLPMDNMWHLEEFQRYLESLGHKGIWERRILPDMQKAIINSMQCSQVAIDVRRGCFELYGADFMISGDDLRPWLIEINASPCMAPSTSVTIDLTAKVLEDTLKVIIDKRTNRNCDVGEFVLLCKQKTGVPGGCQRHDCAKSFAMENSQEQPSSKPIANGVEKTTRGPSSHSSRDLNENGKPRFRGHSESKIMSTDRQTTQVQTNNKLNEIGSTLGRRTLSVKRASSPMVLKASTIPFNAKSLSYDKGTTLQRNGTTHAPNSNGKRLFVGRFRQAATTTSGNSS